MERLFDGLTEYSAHQLDVAKSRYCTLLQDTAANVRFYSYRDNGLLLASLACGLLVTIASSVNLAQYASPTMTSVLATCVPVFSAIGTTLVGLREHLKLRQNATISARLQSRLEEVGYLFVGRAGPYAVPDREKAYTAFLVDMEGLKQTADHKLLSLAREPTSASASGSGSASGPAVVSVSAPPGVPTSNSLDDIVVDEGDAGGDDRAPNSDPNPNPNPNPTPHPVSVSG